MMGIRSVAPPGHLLLADARSRFFDYLRTRTVEPLRVFAIDHPELMDDLQLEFRNVAAPGLRLQEPPHDAVCDVLANCALRLGLVSGELVAFILDDERQRVALPSSGWDRFRIKTAERHKGEEDPSFEFGDEREFLFAPLGDWVPSEVFSDQPSNTAAAPVCAFVAEEPLAYWMKMSFGSAERRRGRPKNSGSYLQDDMPVLQKMKAALEVNAAKSVFGAATMFAFEAKGSDHADSKIRRLDRQYRKLFHNGNSVRFSPKIKI